MDRIQFIRPFAVSVVPGVSLDSLDILMRFQRPTEEQARAGVVEVMNAFEALGASGALAGSHYDPGRSRFMTLGNEWIATESRWKFHLSGIDQASLSILLNMIHYIHLEDSPLSSVHIAWPNLGHIPDPQVLRFPGQWPKLSYRLQIESLVNDFDVVVGLSARQQEVVLKKVIDVMSGWLLACHRGAYADETFDPSSSAVFLGPDVMDVTPDRIVWFIDAMRCNEAALNGLFNVLEWAHQNVTPISYVEAAP